MDQLAFLSYCYQAFAISSWLANPKSLFARKQLVILSLKHLYFIQRPKYRESSYA